MAEMIAEREEWLSERCTWPADAIQTTALPDKAIDREIVRLMQGGANNIRRHEAEAAAQWQTVHGVRLAPYDGRPADIRKQAAGLLD